MFTRILIPTDGSELSQQAVLAGMTLASKLGAEVIGLSVMPRFHTVSLDPDMLEDLAERFRQRAQAQADDYLTFVSKAAADAGVSSTVETGTSDDPWQAIIDTALARVRPGGDGLARTQGVEGAAVGEQDPKGARQQHHSGVGLRLKFCWHRAARAPIGRPSQSA